jgi:hypothetical protein
MMIYYLYIRSYMFRSYDHHQAEKYIATLGLLNSEMSNLNAIFHQNIRGLRNKSDELLHSFEIDATSPHVLCLSEHHMVEQDLLHLSVNGYQLRSSFC